MKKLVTLMFVLSFVFLSACSTKVSNESNNTQFENMKKEYEQLQQNYASLEADYSKAKEELKQAQESSEIFKSAEDRVTDERDELERTASKLEADLLSAQGEINQLELKMQNYDLHEIIDYGYSYKCTDILDMIGDSSDELTIFNARLLSVTEGYDEKVQRSFVFEVDKIEKDEEWTGPGRTENGYFKNDEEIIEYYYANERTVFENRIYESDSKWDKVLELYTQRISESSSYDEIYKFYAIGDHVVFMNCPDGP